MATSTLLQKLDVEADGFGASTSNRRQIETFLVRVEYPTGGPDPGTITITAGDWVALDTTQSGADRALCIRTAANVALGNPLVVGVALDSASLDPLEGDPAISAPIRVVIAGYAEAANVDGAVAAGSPLVVDTTAGRAHVAVTGDLSVCGVALAADVANVAPVWVYKQF